jgi:hypothetical protein
VCLYIGRCDRECSTLRSRQAPRGSRPTKSSSRSKPGVAELANVVTVPRGPMIRILSFLPSRRRRALLFSGGHEVRRSVPRSPVHRPGCKLRSRSSESRDDAGDVDSSYSEVQTFGYEWLAGRIHRYTLIVTIQARRNSISARGAPAVTTPKHAQHGAALFRCPASRLARASENPPRNNSRAP